MSLIFREVETDFLMRIMTAGGTGGGGAGGEVLHNRTVKGQLAPENTNQKR